MWLAAQVIWPGVLRDIGLRSLPACLSGGDCQRYRYRNPARQRTAYSSRFPKWRNRRHFGCSRLAKKADFWGLSRCVTFRRRQPYAVGLCHDAERWHRGGCGINQGIRGANNRALLITLVLGRQRGLDPAVETDIVETCIACQRRSLSC